MTADQLHHGWGHDPNGAFSLTHTSSLGVLAEGTADLNNFRSALDVVRSAGSTISRLSGTNAPIDPTTVVGQIESAAREASNVATDFENLGDALGIAVTEGLPSGSSTNKGEIGGLAGFYVTRDLTNTDRKQVISHVMLPELAGAAVGGLMAFGATTVLAPEAEAYAAAIAQAGADLGVFAADVATGLSSSYPRHEFGIMGAFWLDSLHRANASWLGGSAGTGGRLQMTWGSKTPFASTM